MEESGFWKTLRVAPSISSLWLMGDCGLENGGCCLPGVPHTDLGPHHTALLGTAKSARSSLFLRRSREAQGAKP